MKFMNFIILFSLLVIVASCSKDEDPCSNASNIDDAKCQKNIGNVNPGAINLSLKFLDTNFYNPLEKEWKSITAANLNGGILGHNVPIYSSFLGMSKTQALDLIKMSNRQKEIPNSSLEEDYSSIPYISIEMQRGVEYVYRYKKKSLEGVEITSHTGTMIESEGVAYLPLINAMFQGQFYSSTDQVGARFVHEIQIVAQAENIQGQVPKVIEFESFLQTPITDFYVDYSTSIKNFNLRERFNHYFNGSDGTPNQNLSFLTLRQITTPEATRADLRIMFKQKPKIVIEQEIFFENPLDLDRFKERGEVSIVRGQNFYTKVVTLDSNSFFNMKVRMNGDNQNLTDGRVFDILNVPAGTPWDLEFLMDLRPNSMYQGVNPLIIPYKPTCHEITNTDFRPLESRAEKLIGEQSGGFFAVCHPETNAKLFLDRNAAVVTPLSLTDTFYDYFNYIPEDVLKNVTGHFNGIRRVTFKLEGCMRVYARNSGGTGNYELISKKAEACVDANEQNDGLTGWVYFNASRTYTINQDLDRFDSVPGLKSLIQTFGTKSVRRTPYFKFNGLVDDLDHLY